MRLSVNSLKATGAAGFLVGAAATALFILSQDHNPDVKYWAVAILGGGVLMAAVAALGQGLRTWMFDRSRRNRN